MERLEQIKHCFHRSREVPGLEIEKPVFDDMRWLIAEVERLRRIEDAATAPLFVLDDENAMRRNQIAWQENLVRTIKNNPRPSDEAPS